MELAPLSWLRLPLRQQKKKRKEEEELIPSGFIGPRLMPRWIQAVGIARRAELLKANNKDGEFPDGTCAIMKKWANSHRQALLKALSGLTKRPKPEEASQPSAPAAQEGAQEEAVASTPEEGLTLGQV